MHQEESPNYTDHGPVFQPRQELMPVESTFFCAYDSRDAEDARRVAGHGFGFPGDGWPAHSGHALPLRQASLCRLSSLACGIGVGLCRQGCRLFHQNSLQFDFGQHPRNGPGRGPVAVRVHHSPQAEAEFWIDCVRQSSANLRSFRWGIDDVGSPLAALLAHADIDHGQREGSWPRRLQ